MFCPSCGKQIPDGSMTCPVCGANLAGAPQGAAPGPQPDPAPQPAPGPMPQAGPGPAPQPGQPYGPGAPAYNPMAAFKSSSLFSNVGNKLCTFALWLFWCGLGVSAFNGIIAIVNAVQAGGLGGLGGLFGGVAAGAVVIGVIGALLNLALQLLIFFVASLAVYAIGDMARKKGI